MRRREQAAGVGVAEGNGADSPRVGVVVVHGVADAEQGHNLKTLVETLEKRAKGRLKAEPYLEVHEIREKSLVSSEKAPQPFFVRHAVLDKRNVTFAEVFWADTTRVATGKGTALAAAFRIVFEMHYFINAFVPWNSKSYFARPLIILLHLAAFLIRGPIVGLNTVLIAVATAYVSGQAIAALAGNRDLKVMELATMVRTVSVLVLLSAIYYTLKNAGVRLERLKRWWRWRLKITNQIDPVALEVSTFVAIVAIWICFAVPSAGTDVPAQICNCLGAPSANTDVPAYGSLIFQPLMWVWRGLSAVVLVAAFVAVILTFVPPDGLHRRSLWAAVGIVILQAALWALFIALPAILLVGLSALANIKIGTDVAGVKDDLGMNFVWLIGLGVIGGVVMFLRWWIGRRARKPAPAGRSRARMLDDLAGQMPRLIMHPVMLIAIVAVGLFSAYGAVKNDPFPVDLGDHAFVFAGLVFLLTLALYSVLDTKAFVNVVHIARDLIDHHYAPKIGLGFLVQMILPHKMPHHPRRARLQLRVRSALEHLVNKDRCEIVIFAAHSQGTVIVHEHFRGRMEGPHVAREKTAVVTFGSPLTHLYAHYFHDYARLGTQLERHKERISSWTNLYRIDDPIGSRIDYDDTWMVNTAMEPGGHTNYWVEDTVADAILAAIDRLTASANVPAPGP